MNTHKKLTRREFLGGMILAPAPLLMATPRFMPFAQNDAGIRSEKLEFGAGQFGAGQRQGPLLLQSGRLVPSGAGGTFVSHPVRANFPFQALMIAQTLAGTGTGAPLIFVRTASADMAWSEWYQAEPDHEGERDDLPAGDARITSLLTVEGEWIQWRAEWAEGARGLEQLTISYVDPGPSPATDAGADLAPAGRVARPYIISRAAWGCPQAGYSPDWPPEYSRWHHMAIHHTVSSNTYTDGAAQVRIIWNYHTFQRDVTGWGDIGYQFLVDRFGNIYQGRFGGDDVIGAHVKAHNSGSCGISIIGTHGSGGPYAPVPVPGAAQDAVLRLLAWLAQYREIYPLGTSWMIDANVNNIAGHRDYPGQLGTTCPGEYGYALIPYFRQSTWDRIPDRDYGWLGHNTPAIMKYGQPTTAALAVANHGRLTWPAGGANPVRVGYHWYRSNGTLYTQPPAEDIRTPLPGDVPFGKRVDVTAEVTAPREAGNFTLKWDVVQEGVTWFHDQGAAELAVLVTVLDPPLRDYRWLSHNTPAAMNAGQTVNVNVTLRNEGRMTWRATGTNPVHLGYHWYRSDGTQYVQAAADDHRTTLSGDVPPDASTSISALVTPPRHRGTYVLRWDLVEEGVTWFAAQGAQELAVTVVVEGLEIDVVPSGMSFLFTPDATQTSRQMTITPAGVGTLQWSATTTAPWLHISPTSGTGASVTTVAVDPALVEALPMGTHVAAIRLNWVGNAATPVDVQVAVGKWAALKRGFLPAVQR